MKILVMGGTGTVGSQVVRELLASKVWSKYLRAARTRRKVCPEGFRASVTGFS